MEETEYSVSENFGQFVTCLESLPSTKNKKNKSKKNNKKRFSDEQIRLLESIFESNSKLEPKKKAQLARELGLQPRQVAIWFQNRRARWKSKQIEKEFRKLKAEYDSLATKFDSLKDENQSLHTQVQKLNDLLGKPQDLNSRDSKGLKENCKVMNWKTDEKCSLQERLGLDQSRGNIDSCNIIRNINAGDTREQAYELLNSNNQHVDASFMSMENWYSYDPSRW